MSTQIDQLDLEIASLAAQITAATHTLLTKVRLFDEAQGWGSQGFLSCAQYLSFRIGLSLPTAYEHMRVARALTALPKIDAAFAAGSISYSKVRALTRIGRPETDEALLIIAHETTASQLEKIVRGCRRAEDASSAEKREAARFVGWHHDDDGMLVIQGRLLPEEGALFMQALSAMPTPKERMDPGARRADALVQVASAALSGAKASSNADRYQVIVHVDAEVLADPQADGRAEVAGTGVSSEVVRRLACDASVVTMTHDKDGNVVDVGRKTRRISTPLRRKLAERDGCCRFPGCTNTFVDAHHLRHWCDGGETTLSNLIELCRRHHALVHERGFTVDHEGTFRTPAGERIAQAPISAAGILPPAQTTEMPTWRGDRIDYGYVVANVLG